MGIPPATSHLQLPRHRNQRNRSRIPNQQKQTKRNIPRRTPGKRSWLLQLPKRPNLRRRTLQRIHQTISGKPTHLRIPHATRTPNPMQQLLLRLHTRLLQPTTPQHHALALRLRPRKNSPRPQPTHRLHSALLALPYPNHNKPAQKPNKNKQHLHHHPQQPKNSNHPPILEHRIHPNPANNPPFRQNPKHHKSRKTYKRDITSLL